MKKVKNYLWWIRNKKGSMQGEWKSKEEAEKVIKNSIKNKYFGKDSDWRSIKFEAIPCPVCKRLATKFIIEEIGECFNCDHLRGDI